MPPRPPRALGTRLLQQPSLVHFYMESPTGFMSKAREARAWHSLRQRRSICRWEVGPTVSNAVNIREPNLWNTPTSDKRPGTKGFMVGARKTQHDSLPQHSCTGQCDLFLLAQLAAFAMPITLI